MSMPQQLVEEGVYFVYMEFGIGLQVNIFFHVLSRQDKIRDPPVNPSSPPTTSRWSGACAIREQHGLSSLGMEASFLEDWKMAKILKFQVLLPEGQVQLRLAWDLSIVLTLLRALWVTLLSILLQPQQEDGLHLGTDYNNTGERATCSGHLHMLDLSTEHIKPFIWGFAGTS